MQLFIVGRTGKVLDTWYGYEKGHKLALAALAKAGLRIEQGIDDSSDRTEVDVRNK